MLGMEPPVEVDGDRAFIVWAGFHAFIVIADPPGEFWRDQRLGKHIGAETVDHLG